MDDIVNKRPSMQFYPADWLKDPDLQICSMNTIGIWINVMCRMWEAKEEGVLRGKIGELALLVGARPAEFKNFLKEAKEHNFCDVLRDVTKSYGIVTIKCRRMNRAFLEREGAKGRMRKLRGGPVTDMLRAPSSSSSSSSITTTKNTNNIPSQKSLFETARKEYPGTKRGLDEEWDYLDTVCRKYKLNREQTVPKIVAGVSRLLKWRNDAAAAKIFVPSPKNFNTWLYNRCWTIEFSEIPHVQTVAEKQRAYDERVKQYER